MLVKEFHNQKQYYHYMLIQPQNSILEWHWCWDCKCAVAICPSCGCPSCAVSCKDCDSDEWLALADEAIKNNEQPKQPNDDEIEERTKYLWQYIFLKICPPKLDDFEYLNSFSDEFDIDFVKNYFDDNK